MRSTCINLSLLLNTEKSVNVSPTLVYWSSSQLHAGQDLLSGSVASGHGGLDLPQKKPPTYHSPHMFATDGPHDRVHVRGQPCPASSEASANVTSLGLNSQQAPPRLSAPGAEPCPTVFGLVVERQDGASPGGQYCCDVVRQPAGRHQVFGPSSGSAQPLGLVCDMPFTW